ncbi:hypothetical protein M5D96_003821 [Drosophila gunungcola]|uniref:Uncharacterized protein n=1 Tax=Drosophila gunungcola TaxID=103775 RepID=A0A9P9YTC3_9MUSC|nr:hypothetical protein M5D96_003821 [Drosophila gunungcola]
MLQLAPCCCVRFGLLFLSSSTVRFVIHPANIRANVRANTRTPRAHTITQIFMALLLCVITSQRRERGVHRVWGAAGRLLWRVQCELGPALLDHLHYTDHRADPLDQERRADHKAQSAARAR